MRKLEEGYQEAAATVEDVQPKLKDTPILVEPAI